MTASELHVAKPRAVIDRPYSANY